MYELPTKVDLNDDIQYGIRNGGDFRTILDIFSVLEDQELEKQERIVCALIIFYEDLNSLEDVLALSEENMETAVKKMFDFFNAGRSDTQQKQNYKLMDWNDDSAIIISAVNNVAGKEVRQEEYCHWWTFMSYYMAIGESTLSTVLAIRDKILKGKTLEKWENQFKADNPQYFNWNHKTADELEAESWLMSVWNKE